MHVLGILLAHVLCGASANDAVDGQQLAEMVQATRWSIAPEISWFHYEEPDEDRDQFSAWT